MQRKIQGRYVISSTAGETVRAFVPTPLPPRPPVDWTPALRSAFDRALVAVGRLDGASRLLPDPTVFLYLLVRKEAVLSSMIEGTQSTLADLLRFEAGQDAGAHGEDVREVSRCVAAMNHGLRRLEEGFPLSLRLLREIHGILMSGGRGSALRPGEFRTSQNWIGGTRPGNAAFVPPPPEELLGCLSDLERYLHDPEAGTPILKAALTHVQFETIHPFLDGNGRVGRLLVTLLLCDAKLLRYPLLYLSLPFKARRREYYDRLDDVRRTGDWETWLAFFADAVETGADDATEAIRRLLAVADADRARLATLGRGAATARTVHDVLLRHPIATPAQLVRETGLSGPTVQAVLVRLAALGIVREMTGRKRDRVFRYDAYMDILDEGAAPLA